MFEHDYSPTREQTIRWRSRNEGMSERWKMQEGENDRWQKRDTIERNRNSDDRSLTRDRSPHRKGKERGLLCICIYIYVIFYFLLSFRHQTKKKEELNSNADIVLFWQSVDLLVYLY